MSSTHSLSGPTISVIIPHLNQPHRLELCLRALHQQSLRPDRFEIVVVDNGSQTLPRSICQEFGVRLENESAAGPGPARNKGVAVSRGSILAFIDADCVPDRQWLEVIERTLQVSGDTKIIGGDVRIERVEPLRPTMLEAYESVFSFRQQMYIEKQGYSATLNLAMRRDAFDAVGPFGGIQIAEDSDWGKRARRLGYVTRYVPDMIVSHPARESAAEIRRKLDRTMGHDFTLAGGFGGRLRWLLRALAIALSPPLAWLQALSSLRVSTWRERLLAATAVTHFRLYRSTRMLRLLINPSGGASRQEWNRPPLD